MRPPLTFGRVLSRLGKVQTSLPLLSLLQNLRESYHPYLPHTLNFENQLQGQCKPSAMELAPIAMA
jgi:hypothetical protein